SGSWRKYWSAAAAIQGVTARAEATVPDTQPRPAATIPRRPRTAIRSGATATKANGHACGPGKQAPCMAPPTPASAMSRRIRVAPARPFAVRCRSSTVMGRLLLIWPRTRDFPVYERLIPTLTLPYIAGLTPPGWEVRFADDNYGEVDLSADVDLVGISVNTMSAVRAYALADAVRARGIGVVLGGWHVAFCPDEASAHADAVVVGEADDTWRRLLEDFKAGALAARYVSRNDTDLSHYPHVDRHLLDGRQYFTHNLLQATRGCPYRCSFCSVSTVNPKYRRRPVADVVEEIARLDGRTLFFIDDNLPIHREYTAELFRALIPLRRKWVGEASITSPTIPSCSTWRCAAAWSACSSAPSRSCPTRSAR